MTKKNKGILFGVIGLVVAVAVMALLYFCLRPKTNDAGGSKKITVTVVYADKTSKDFTYKTDLDWLGELLLNEKLIEGSNGEWGLYVTTVDGITASDDAHEYWALYIGEEYSMTGFDTTPINDGDHFSIKLETY